MSGALIHFKKHSSLSISFNKSSSCKNWVFIFLDFFMSSRVLSYFNFSNFSIASVVRNWSLTITFKFVIMA